MINHELRQKWLDALRSGAYTQAHYRMKVGNGFCCLGVALDVAKFDWKDFHESLQSSYIGQVSQGINALIGLTRAQQNELATRNDAGRSFPEIADRIEAMFSEDKA